MKFLEHFTILMKLKFMDHYCKCMEILIKLLTSFQDFPINNSVYWKFKGDFSGWRFARIAQPSWNLPSFRFISSTQQQKNKKNSNIPDHRSHFLLWWRWPKSITKTSRLSTNDFRCHGANAWAVEKWKKRSYGKIYEILSDLFERWNLKLETFFLSVEINFQFQF